jgi:hypothetical protein
VGKGAEVVRSPALRHEDGVEPPEGRTRRPLGLQRCRIIETIGNSESQPSLEDGSHDS